jgi:hypothetical protein
MNESAKPKMVPTIGRRVWYRPSDYDRGLLAVKPDTVIQASDKTQPCDAGIVYVHSENMVNLVVTDHNGHVHRRPSITLISPDEPAPQGAYATWMPFQVGK